MSIKRYLQKKLGILSPSVATLQAADYFFFGKEPTEEYRQVVDVMISYYGVEEYLVKGFIEAAQKIEADKDIL